MSVTLLTLQIRLEPDVVLARQRARQLAELLGFDTQEQTRIATAVSEVARNAFRYAGGGKAVFVVDPSVTEPQIEALSQIFTGKLGGLPWELLGTTFEVVGLVKARISIEGEGQKSVFRAEGVGEAKGDTFKNPVTGDDHFVNVDLPDGFIWKHGQCGQGSFRASAAGLSLAFEKTNWILYDFDWTNGR